MKLQEVQTLQSCVKKTGLNCFKMAEMDPIKGLNDAKSIEDLQNLGSVQCQNPDLLLIVAPIFLKTAKQSALTGDHEKAYVLFLKYCEAAKNIRSSKQYKKNKLSSDKYDAIVNSKSVEEALDHLGTVHVFTEHF